MNKKKRFFIILFCIMLAGFGITFFLKENMDRIIINRIIENDYPEYKITDVKYEYTDFYSSIRPADKENPPTLATITIKKDEEERIIYLEKYLFVWKITEDNVNSGSNIPNDQYFFKRYSTTVRSDVNIEEHIRSNKYWVIPDENGNDYHRLSSGNYSLYICEKIYKTENHVVFEYNEDEENWVISSVSYSNLLYYGNYEEVAKSDALNLIKKYSSYYKK